MKYQITKQYARDLENLFAEFTEEHDAKFFIERKLLADDEKSLLLIYRLYENHKLINEVNKEKIQTQINHAQYAEGDRDLPYSLGPFKVCKEASTASALAAFIELNDAELFVEDKLTHTTAITTYFIFNHENLIIEINQRIKKQSQVKDGAQGRTSTASFRPTPLNTTPRPPGTPPPWLKDEDEDKE